MNSLKTLHDRWVKNRSCIHFSVSIRLLDGKIQAELKDAPPQYKKALLSMMEMIMSNGVLYIKAAYHDAIRKKGLDVNEKKVHDDLDLRLVPLIDICCVLCCNSDHRHRRCICLNQNDGLISGCQSFLAATAARTGPSSSMAKSFRYAQDAREN